MTLLHEAVINMADYKRKQNILKGIKTLEEMLRWSMDSAAKANEIIKHIYEKNLGKKTVKEADLSAVLNLVKDLKEELNKR